MPIPDNNHSLADQNSFWDSLRSDILASKQTLTQEDYRSFLERGFLFSVYFRRCSPAELLGYQNILNFKDNGYALVLDVSQLASVDELEFHHFLKNLYPDRNIIVGPNIINRICLMITSDTLYPEQVHKEQSVSLAMELREAITQKYQVAISIGIGSQQKISTVYTSFIDALSPMYFNQPGPVIYYKEIRQESQEPQFDYSLTEHRFLDALRLRKAEAYDLFGLLMNHIRAFSDSAKRNKILELLVLANRTMELDSNSETMHFDYTAYADEFMSLHGEQLIEFAYRIFLFITGYEKPQNTIDYSNHVVKATWDYLEEHYEEDITLEDISGQVNISPQYFSKLIKKSTGFNFTDWLAMLRVRKAKELLTSSNLTVKEVCFMVGYKDPNYFSRIFKKRIGITPSEYVKTSRN